MKTTLFEDALILSAIRLARWSVKCLPGDVCLVLARGVGTVVYVFSKRRRIAYKNLRMAFAGEKSLKELRRLALRSFQNLAMAGAEMLRIPDMTNEYIESHYRIEGREHFEPFVREKKGVILLTGHFGSWELLNIAGAMLGYPLVVFARAQKHPRSDAYLNQLRTYRGCQVIYKGTPIREILRALKKGKMVGILSDQDGGRSGRFVNFFNRLSSTPPGAAAFSLHTGAPIFPVYIVREHGGIHRIVIEPAIRLDQGSLSREESERRILQQFADVLERAIRRWPEQWLWAHRRWKSSPERKVVVLSDGKAGHLKQSLVVLDAMRRERESRGVGAEHFWSCVVEVRYRSDFRKKCWKTAGILFRGNPPFAGSWLSWALTPECARQVQNTYADVVVSCGASAVEVNLWMKKENGAKSVVVMAPRVSSEAFDAIIVPKHDKLKAAENVFLTDGALTRLSLTELTDAGAALARRLGVSPDEKFIGLLIGGDTAELQFDPIIFERWMLSILNFARHTDAQILVTTSRRTPPWAEQSLKQLFGDITRCPLLVIANEANRDDILPGILGLSAVVLVSAESMSMVSEAVASGKRALVFHPCRRARFKRKYTRLLERWEKEHKIEWCDADGVAQGLERTAAGLKARENQAEETERALLEAARRVF